jgi:hypothetical protein
MFHVAATAAAGCPLVAREQSMKTAPSVFAGALLVAVLSTAQAAPNIPPSEMPGRDRYRFQESPLDRFTDPTVKPRSEPLWQWRCHQRSTSHYRRARKNQRC